MDPSIGRQHQLTVPRNQNVPLGGRFREAFQRQPMNWREHISIDADRMHGTPCLRGTRVPVYVVLDNLAAGERVEAILAAYPSL